ncbi:MAG: hypothetical protein RMK01_12850 [Thermomicrobium sp.]|nr:hypothetical protein [Thermomicrobium sp.]
MLVHGGHALAYLIGYGNREFQQKGLRGCRVEQQGEPRVRERLELPIRLEACIIERKDAWRHPVRHLPACEKSEHEKKGEPAHSSAARSGDDLPLYSDHHVTDGDACHDGSPCAFIVLTVYRESAWDA